MLETFTNVNYLKGMEYMLLVFSVLIIGSIARAHNVFVPVYDLLHRLTGNRKVGLTGLSMMCGSLPVSGRVSVTAPIIYGMGRNTKKLGVLDYLATHHYYLWSPIEKSVIIIMAGLAMSYTEFLAHTWPLLVAYLGYMFWHIFRLNLDDVELKTGTGGYAYLPFIAGIVASFWFKSYYVFPLVAAFYVLAYKEFKLWDHINWKVVGWVVTVIMLGNLVKSLHLEQMVQQQDVWIVVAAAFGLAFAMGSSSKYAATTVLLVPFVGMENFLWLFAAEYIGYMLSPMHKCTHIAREYFGTPMRTFYGHVMTATALVAVATTAHAIM